MEIRVGQVLEFVKPATVAGRAIGKGTRVRIGHILAELPDDKLTLVVLGEGPPQTLVASRREVTVNCRIVSEP